MAERQLTRKQVAERYGMTRNAIYDWVRQGMLPDADIHRSNQSRWSDTRLARWERRHLRQLTGRGVDIDQLPQFVEMRPGASQPRPPARGKAKAKPGRQGPGPAAEAFAELAKARDLLIRAMAGSRQLTRPERNRAAAHLKQAVALLCRRGGTGA